MNVASIELCKELYELSGWGDTEFHWSEQYTSDTVGLSIIPVNIKFAPSIAPAYDAGYLLRQLPDAKHKSLFWKDGKWYAELEWTGSIADTPENALCKLAIELFKQGILTK